MSENEKGFNIIGHSRTPMAQVSLHPPENFTPKASIAACYLECDGKLLLLCRSSGKQEVVLWGVPAGKIEAGETPLQAAERELFEETAVVIDPNLLQDLGTLYIRKPEIDYTYSMFRYTLTSLPLIRLNEENDAFHWASINELET